jgi:hypothetical protein
MVHWLSVYGRYTAATDAKLYLWSGTYLYSMQKHCSLLGLDLEFYLCFFSPLVQPNAGCGLLFHEVSRLLTTHSP